MAKYKAIITQRDGTRICLVVRLKNEDQFKISFEEYEKIKKEIL